MTKCVLHLTDQHFPYHDPSAIEASIEAARLLQPDEIILGGDLIDGYSLSRFTKDHSKFHSLKRELDYAKRYLLQLKSHTGALRWLKGNHEERFTSYINNNAPALATLSSLSLESFMGAEAIGLSTYRYGDSITVGDIKFIHGAFVRKGAGRSAASHSEAEGRNIAMGHSHRLGMCLQRHGSRVWHAYESGCLCKLNQGYMKHTPDWQQGFSVFYFGQKKKGHLWQPVHLGNNGRQLLRQLLKK